MPQPVVQMPLIITPEDCVALIECLDQVPTIGLANMKRNIMLEQKLFAYAQALNSVTVEPDLEHEKVSLSDSVDRPASS